MAVTPFTVQVPDVVLEDLKQRIDDTRWPDEIPGSGWDYGTNMDYLKELVGYWRNGYDWRAQERMLNGFPQFKADVEGSSIHYAHVKGKGPNPVPLIISHGWPGSFFEMYKVIGPLSDPAAHGGDAADSFDVIAPSLPGYGFSDRTTERGVNVARIAERFMKLMTESLGYERYGAQGGDWGATITTRMGYAYPDKVLGIHLNMVSGGLPPPDDRELTEEESRWVRKREHFRDEEQGYSRIQGTKPQTLAYGLNDSPAGLAGWIVEKFRTWSDCGGDVESVYTKDELLTNITIYWVTQTVNSSTRLYYEQFHNPTSTPPGERVEVPTGVALFPEEIITPPRWSAEGAYNIQRWTPMPSGGHFAALEKPDLLVEDIRDFFRPLRR